ncbi:hypothetical protein ZYGR_0P01080 [Zygosaccharomyces rouxii]|uniref:ZYRO0E02684p n=2 Tax=Zygosaccharomyces rouxii TaxID=4956 RepID=C5E445_ZYGRC|nr:uncharacterized protein ZYRO0E02684g [Zygosaccharomyces rouxii]KAH9198334.1 hypothetical protein LQ764DRAFT_157638 [Zygosaccharomyces rouxii]GAV49464.1 hypothetical protein ZYGR_0P01080 [Zygosaccharomyces rouxii]CAR30806.1 ZYRO0E02684p [Zygosaccharomyces rouxii]
MAVKVEMSSSQREIPQQVRLPPISMLVPATYVQEQLYLPPLAAQQQQQQQKQDVKDGLNPVIRLRKQCPVCGKICSRPSTLKTHFLIHTGDTPFKCTWQNCQKSFNVKSNMLRHLKSHERRLAKQTSQTNQRF